MAWIIFSQFSDLCIGCRRCTTICPGKIDIPGLIEELRRRNFAQKGQSLPEKIIFKKVMSNRKLFHHFVKSCFFRTKTCTIGKFYS